MFLFDILYNHLSFLKHTKLKSMLKKIHLRQRAVVSELNDDISDEIINKYKESNRFVDEKRNLTLQDYGYY